MSNIKYGRNEYIGDYMRAHYKLIQMQVKPTFVDMVNEHCNKIEMSRQKFLQACALYVIQNNVSTEELKSMVENL